jgi:hypothetical protein
MLARLQTLSDDHFNTHPDEINWADVGTLEHYAMLAASFATWSAPCCFALRA